MRRLDQKSVVPFFIQGVLVGMVVMFFFIPISFVVAIPATIYALITSNENTLVFLTGNFARFYAIIALLIPFIWAFFAYYVFRYKIGKKNVEIFKGFLWKQHIIIPISRVQNINVVQNPIMQILNIADVRIETAGSSRRKSEGRIPGVTPKEADRIRTACLKKSHS